MVLLLYSYIDYIESEQNFMDNDSQDDLISVRNACKHMCITWKYCGIDFNYIHACVCV